MTTPYILMIEDNAPVMRLIAWVLRDDGFDVRVVSRRDALGLHGLRPPDIAIFNMKATGPQKTLYNNHLLMLNPAISIIDGDELASTGSTRDSTADVYLRRPLTLQSVSDAINEIGGRSLAERRDLRARSEPELRGSSRPDIQR